MKTTRIEFGFGIELNRDGDRIPDDLALYAKTVLCVAAAKRFGGYTWKDVDGGWLDKTDGRFFQERAVTLAVLTESEPIGAVSEMVDIIKLHLNQRAVYVVRSTVDAELR